jgi:hypothetical protein
METILKINSDKIQFIPGELRVKIDPKKRLVDFFMDLRLDQRSNFWY